MYYSTVCDHQIMFYSENVDDLDYMVKIVYITTIVAVSKVEKIAKNLWRRGKSNGQSNYLSIERYMSEKRFKALQSIAPYCFTLKQTISWKKISNIGYISSMFKQLQ